MDRIRNNVSIRWYSDDRWFNGSSLSPPLTRFKWQEIRSAIRRTLQRQIGQLKNTELCFHGRSLDDPSTVDTGRVTVRISRWRQILCGPAGRRWVDAAAGRRRRTCQSQKCLSAKVELHCRWRYHLLTVAHLYLLSRVRSTNATNACSVTRSLKLSNVEPG